jgi:hypothetical protein
MDAGPEVAITQAEEEEKGSLQAVSEVAISQAKGMGPEGLGLTGAGTGAKSAADDDGDSKYSSAEEPDEEPAESEHSGE